MTFTTYAPPKGGSVKIVPEYGYIGDAFSITVSGYVDPVSQVYYNVFNSYDAQGTIKGT